MYVPIDPRVFGSGIFLLVLGGIFSFFSRRATLVIFILFLANLAFFRDPPRLIPSGTFPVAPADGHVVEVDSVFEEKYLQEEAFRISIFLSVFDVHVNRTPIGGKVQYSEHRHGKFLSALNQKSQDVNDCHWLGIEGETYRALIQQVAGEVAHRVFCDVSPGQMLKRGQKIGIICYGSRVVCYLPKRYFRPTVKVGDKIKAGETILGEWVP